MEVAMIDHPVRPLGIENRHFVYYEAETGRIARLTPD